VSGLCGAGREPGCTAAPRNASAENYHGKTEAATRTRIKFKPHNAVLLRIALDRIDVLERLVTEMAVKSGAHPPYVGGWRKYKGESLTREAQYILDWARTLNS
jgi:hypothetical protein